MSKNRLISLVAIAALSLGGSQYSIANPSGATVVSGSASFSQPNASTLNVTNSPNTIINWQQFGIGANEVTRFIQQSSSSAVLNRITGQDPSQILGSLTSNGRVFLVNPNGVIFGQNSVIDTAGLITSTLNISNNDFLNGKLRFEDLANNAAILNQGFIHTANNGEVVLIAPNVTNEGVIDVEDGNLLLAAGQSITVSSLNYDNIEFEVQAPENKVVNLGTLLSDGGSIGVFAGSITNKGTVSANAITVDAAGNIKFVAQTDTIIENGTVTATSETGKGGHIEILGDRVALLGETRVDASGNTGGGEVLIGGDYQGKTPEVKNASATVIGGDTKIKADAITNGDGGKIIVWANDVTKFHGDISAKGGSETGNGGFVETSGKNYLEATGSVDTSSTSGTGGEWLLDPRNVELRTVVTTAGDESSDGLFDSLSPNTFTPDNDNDANIAIVDIDQIVLSLEGGTNVTIVTTSTGTTGQAGDITVVDPIVLTLNNGDVTLQLSAENDIFINNSISSSGANALSLTLIADSDSSDSGSITINSAISAGGSINMSGSSITINNTLNAGAMVALNSNDGLSINSDVTAVGNIFLEGDFDFIDGPGLDNINFSGGNVITSTAGLINIRAFNGGTQSSGDVTFNAATDVEFYNGSTYSGTVNVIAGNNVNIIGEATASSTADIYAQIITITAGGDVNLLAGVGSNSHAVLESIVGDITIDAINLNLVSGPASSGSDAIVIANNGTGQLILGATTCANCIAAGFIPGDDAIEQTSVIAANFPFAIFWDEGAGTLNWMDPFNWSTNNLPLGNADVDISAATGTVLFSGAESILSLTSTIPSGIGLTISSGSLGIANASSLGGLFTLSSGSLSIGGDFTLNLGMLWTTGTTIAGDSAGNLIIPSGQILDIIGGGTATLDTASISNDDTLTLSGSSTLDLINGAVLFNTTQFVSVIDIQDDASGITSSDASGSIDNSGTIQKSGGFVTSTISAQIKARDNSTIDNGVTGQLNITNIALEGNNYFTNFPALTGSISYLGDTYIFGSVGLDAGAAVTGNGVNMLINIGTINIDGAGVTTFDNVQLTNAGFITLTSDVTLDLINGTALTNVSEIYLQSDANISGTGSIYNSGRLIKSAGAGTSTISAPLINNTFSEVIIDAGTLSLNGAALILDGSTLGGIGTFSGDVISNAGIIDVGNDSGGTGTLTITGKLTLDSRSTVVFDIAGNSQSLSYDFLDVGSDVVLDGTVAILWDWNGVTPYVAANDDFFDLIQTGGSFSGAFVNKYIPTGVTAYTFDNLFDAKTMRLVTTSVATNNIFFWNLNADGFWDDVNNWFNSAGVITGAVPTASDYVVISQPDENIIITIQDVRSVSGLEAQNSIEFIDNGTIGDLTINGDALIGGTTLTLNSSGGLTVNTGKATIVSQALWQNGDLAGTGSITIHELGSLDIDGGVNMSTTLINNSLSGITWTSGASTGAGTWINNSLLIINGLGNTGTNGSLINSSSGSITKFDANTTGFNSFTNDGFLNIFDGLFEVGSAFTNNGFINLSSGSSFEVLVPGFTNGVTGVLSGTGTYIAPSGGIDNQGIIRPGLFGTGLPGILNITGDLNNTTGTIEIDIQSNGGVPGVDYDRLAISGQADLQGTLTLLGINGYTPTDTDSFTPITYGSSINTFSTINDVAGSTTSALYNPTTFDITLNVAAVGQLISWTGLGDGVSWTDPGNWDLGLPDLIDDVVIGIFNVNIAGTADALSLTLDAGGTLTLSSGTLTIASDSTLDGDLTLSGGTLTGAGNVTLNGIFTWNAGTLIGAGSTTVSALGEFQIGTNNAKTLDGYSLINNSNNINNQWVGATGYATTFNNGATLTNNGLLDIVTTNTITITDGGTGINQFINTGTLTRNGVGTFTINTPFNNNGGTVDAQAGVLSLNGGGASTGGQFNGSGTTGTLRFGGGTHTLNGGGFGGDATGLIDISAGSLTVTGTTTGATGTVQVSSSGTLNFDGTSTLNNLTIDGNSATFGGSGALTANGIFTWNAGTLIGAGSTTVSALGEFQIGTNNAKTLDGYSLINNSNNINNQWVGATGYATTFNNGATLTNNGLLDIVTTNTITITDGGTGINQFINTGTLTRNGVGTFTINTPFNNNGGTVDAQAGSISFGSTYTQSSGSTFLSGGAITLGTLNLNGGTLGGAGSLTGNVLNNGGIIQPGGSGAIGTLNITGNFTNTTGIVEIEIQTGNSNPALGIYDILAISGSAAFDGGSIDLISDGYASTAGDQFEPVTYATLTSSATTVNPIGADTITPTFNPTTALNILIATVGGTTFTWTGLGDGVSWTDPDNWDIGLVLPSTSDDVFIGSIYSVNIAGIADALSLTLDAGGTLTLTSGTFTLASNSTLDGNFTLTGGTLNNGGTLTMNASTFTLNGGTLQNGIIRTINAGVMSMTASSIMNGVTLDADLIIPDATTLTVNTGNLTIVNSHTVTLAGAGGATRLGFGTDQSILGTGDIRITGNSVATTIGQNNISSTLTIDSGITIHGSTAIIGESGATKSIINNGNIISETAGTLTLRDVTNNNLIQALGSDIDLQGTWSNGATGTISVDNGSTLFTSGTWSNTAGGNFNLNTGSTINITGDFTATSALSIVSDGNVLNNYNLVNGGTLDIEGGVFEPTAAVTGTGPINLAGITLSNGTLADGNTVGFTLTGSNVTTFDAITLDTDLTLPDNLSLTVTNNLTFANNRTLTLAGAGNVNRLQFSGPSQSILGNGEIFITGTSSSNRISQLNASTTLTIGNNITIRGVGLVGDNSSGRNIINNGSIIADASGQTLTLQGVSLTNSGILSAQNGATLSLVNLASNDGTLTVGASSTITTNNANITNNALGILEGSGTFDVGAGFAFTNDGIVRPGGSGAISALNITGNFVQSSSGQLEIEIASTASHDILAIDGTATLGGDLILIDSGYVPVDSDSIVPLTTVGGTSLTFDLIDNQIVGTTETVNVNPNDVSVLFNILAALISWDGDAGDGLWTNILNWDDGFGTDVLPTSGDNVFIGAFNVDITSTADALSLTLDAGGTLTLTSGTFTLASDSTLDGNFTLSGGTLNNGGILTMNASTFTLNGGTLQNGIITSTGGGVLNLAANSTLDNVTLDTDLIVNAARTLDITNGLTLGDTALRTLTLDGTVRFLGTDQTLGTNNSGAIVMSSGSLMSPVQNLTVTLGTGISVSGSGTIGDASASRIVASNASVTAGTGESLILSTFNNLAGGSVTATGGGAISMVNTWSNLGVIAVDTGGFFTLGGIFNGSSSIATGFSNDGSGTVNLTGNMTVSTALDFTAGMGDIHFVSGTVTGGTLTSSGGNLLLDVGNGTLNGVTLDMDMLVPVSRTLDITNGLTLGDTALRTLTLDGTVRFLGTDQTLGTNNSGAIVMSSGSLMSPVQNLTVTLGTGISVSGSGTIGDASASRIVASNASVTAGTGESLILSTFNNLAGGTITATGGGAISLTNNVMSNAGTMTVDTGSTITTNNASITNLGTLQGSGNFVVGTGTFTNDGIVAPGGNGATGILSISGSAANIYTQTAAGSLDIEVNDTGTTAGTDFDQLVINSTGVATLDGTLNVTLLGSTPPAGVRIVDVIGGGTLVGIFSTETINAAFVTPPTYGGSFVNLVLAGTSVITWTDLAGNGLWNDIGNWDIRVPLLTDDTTIGLGFNITINGGANANTLVLGSTSMLTLASGTFTLGSDSTLAGSFTISGGILDLNGTTLTLNNNFNWTFASTITNGTMTLAGSSTISGNDISNGQRILDNATINNNGTVVYTTGAGDNLALENGATFINNGSFDIQTGQNVVTSSTGTFVNIGTVLKTTGATNSFTASLINNTGGIFDIAINSINLQGAGTFNGDLVIANNTLTLATGGNYTFSNGSSISGGTLTLGGGDITIFGTATLNSDIVWSSSASAISGGTLAIANTGQMTINGDDISNNPRVLDGATIDNAGLVILATGAADNFALENGAIFNNNPGGTFDFQVNQSVVSGSTGTFNNLGGTLSKTAGAGTSTFSGVVFNSTASIFDIQTGIVRLDSGGTFSGTQAVNSGPITLNGGVFNFTDGGIFNGLTGALSISGGTVNIEGDFTLDTLTLSGGSLVVDQLAGASIGDTLLINTALNWTFVSTIQGGTNGGYVTLTGNSTISGDDISNGQRILDNATINNNGTVVYATGAGDNLALENGATFINNGSFDIQTGQNVVTSSTGTFVNIGTVLKTTGATNSFTASLINNTGGIFDIAINSINLQGAGTFNGDLVIANNTLTLATGGNYTFSNGSSISGGTLTLGGGDITIFGTATLNSDIVWSSSASAISGGTLAIANTGQMTINGDDISNNPRVLDGATITNNGTTVFVTGAGDNLALENGATFINNGSFDIQTGQNVVTSSTGTFVNIGTVLKTTGATNSFTASLINNTGGIFDIAINSINLQGAGTFNGDLVIANNTLTLATGGNYTFSNGSSISGGTLTLGGGDITIFGTATLNSDIVWSSSASAISGGTLAIANTGQMTINGDDISNNPRVLDGATIDNAGLVILATGAADNFALENGAIFNNNPGGTFDFQVNQSVVSGSTGTFNNLGGTLSKTAGAGTSTISTTFANTGGIVDITFGTLSLGGTTLILDTGSVLTGTGIFLGNLINNGGAVQPGGVGTIGTLTINGDFTQTAGSVDIDINSIGTAGINYDLLSIIGTGNATLADTLNLIAVGGYTENLTDIFTPLTYVSRTAAFTTITLGSGTNIAVPNYGPISMSVTINLAGLDIWTGAIDNNWANPLNWSLGLAPITTDVAQIDSGFTVLLTTTPENITSLTLGGGLTINGGTLNISGNSTFLSTSSFTLTGAGILNNPGTINSSGLIVLDGGTINGSGTGVLNANGAVTLSAPTTFNNFTFSLASGQVLASTANLILNNNARFNNLGTYDITAVSADITTSGSGTFNNQGLLINNSGGVLTIDTALINDGTFDVGTSTANLNGTLSGNGTLMLNSSTAGLNLSSNGSTGSLQMSDGLISGAGNITLANLSTVSGGTLAAGGVMNFNGGVNITGSVVLDRTINVTGGSLSAAGNVTNGGSGAFNLAGGVFTASNVGDIETGITISTGTLDITGTLGIVASPIIGITNNGGTIVANGEIIGNVFNNSGTLQGTGIITGNVVNNATLSPGNSPGTLTVDGNLDLLANSNLIMEITGLDAASYDRLIVTGVLTFGGTLTTIVDTTTYTARLDDTFNPFTYSAFTGTFARVINDQGFAYELAYIDTTVDVVTTAVPGLVLPTDLISEAVTFSKGLDTSDLQGDVTDIEQDIVAEDDEEEEDSAGQTMVCS